MVKHGGLAMKHGNSPMNKCITVDYVCVYIYICTVHRHIVWEHNKGGPRGLGPEISHLPSEKQNKNNFAEISSEYLTSPSRDVLEN